MKKVLIVFGTRPEAVKMCPLIKVLQKSPEIQTVICVTGQHRHMLDQVLEVFDIHPDYDLKVMRDRQTLFDIHETVMKEIRPVLIKEAPDIVLLHGDTSSAMACALAAFYLKIPVGHVEAGLRTYTIDSPFPEELNRQTIGLISRYHFAPTQAAADNLIQEGKDPSLVYITGNTGIDALRYTWKKDFYHPELDWSEGRRLILLTAHRRENIGKPMHQMFRAIRRVLEEHLGCRMVFPLHANPEVRSIAEEEFAGCSQIHMIEPPDVISWHNLEARCFLCLTDSGGVQEECAYFGRPVLVLRDHTERPEGIEAGVAKLVGTEEESVYQSFSELLENQNKYQKMCRKCTAYGDGYASERILYRLNIL